MTANRRTFSRLESRRREQTPQALARLVVIGVFIGLWLLLWLARIPMPVPFLAVLVVEAGFFLVYWRTVFLLPTARSVTIAQYCMLAAEIVFHTTIVYFLGGITWLGAFAYVFGLIFTNTFLDMRRGMVYTTGASLAFASLVLLEATGTIPHYAYLESGPMRFTDGRFVATTLIGGIGVFFSIYVWVNWVGHQLRQERDTAVHVQEQLLHARGALQQANEELEARVGLRTAELERANDALRESQEHLRAVITNAPVLLAALNVDGVFTLLEGRGLEGLGIERDSLIGHSVFDVFRNDAEVLAGMRRALGGEPATVVMRSGRLWFETQLVPVQGNGDRLAGVIGVATDVTERRQAEQLLMEQRRLLEMISIGEPLQEILETTVRVIEDQSPGTLCALCLVDEDASLLRTVAAPNLPDTFLDAIAGGVPIGPRAGSCGTAAHRGETVVVEDIGSDPLWAAFRDVALRHDLRACWSTPIISTAGTVLGTFAMYSRQPGGPSAEQRRHVDVAARTAAIAIERKRSEQALQFTQFSVDRAGDAVFWMRSDGRFVYVNDAACDSLGYSRDELLTMAMPDIEANGAQSNWSDHWKEIKRRGSFRFESIHRRRDGRMLPVEITVNYLEFNDIEYNCAFARDITDRKRTEEALRESESKFRTTAETIAAAVFIFQEGELRYVNSATEQMTGYTREELIGKRVDELVHPDSRGETNERGPAPMEGKTVPQQYEVKIVTKDGTEKWVDFTGSVFEFQGEPAVLGTAFDVTDRKRVEAALQKAANHDPLTGLLNRRAGIEAIGERLEAATQAGQRMAVIVLDLDEFKKINDSFSHETGDAALVRFAQLTSDLVAERGVLCRLGGDEFEVALDDAGLDEALEFAGTLRESLRSALRPAGAAQLPMFTVSMGIACYPNDGEDIETLGRRADQAMYAAKAAGGDRWSAWRRLAASRAA